MYRGHNYANEKQTGNEAEKQFEEWLKKEGIEYSRSNWSADYYGHVDFILWSCGEMILVDVKSNKFQRGEEKMACFELGIANSEVYEHYNTPQYGKPQITNTCIKRPSSMPSPYLTTGKAKYDYMVFMIDGEPHFIQRHNNYLYNLLIDGINNSIKSKGLHWQDITHRRNTAGFYNKKAFNVYPNQNQIVKVWLTYIPYDYMKHYMMDWQSVTDSIRKEASSALT